MPNLHIKKRELCCLTILPYINDINKKAVMDRSIHCFLFVALVANSFD
ncbi:hypothetical protein VCRA2121O157_300011 [Vibrio crassostreae]|nr:hypothetical protein VCRA2119O145_100041 [Vibrio crassostreae]CAK1705028.1 hypothetical protein VCRA2111O320_100125 [Vibrio crassostreae]CAK1706022.1 hypothetical protein VCRA2112O189_100134 [Vibrio crassostreae]CAK1706843.1 hypothetical protein VCRA2110O135_100134 [Vibrio crassostreae]CAK1714209.1 hypothetical protein VCRA2113O212_110040 [Vibrio crassostreae]